VLRRVVAPLAVAAAAEPPAPPVKLTAQEDHRRTMAVLGIKELRRGPDGNPRSPNAANLDEAKANPYPDLPDPLTLKDGTKVTTRGAVADEAPAEIVEDFDREVYGRAPKDTPTVTWQLDRDRDPDRRRRPGRHQTARRPGGQRGVPARRRSRSS